MNENTAMEDTGRLILRLCVGILMLFHGVEKVQHQASVDFIMQKVVALGMPEWVAYGVYPGEILAPLMLILGFYARLGGMLIVINMVFAILLMHGNDFLSLTQHGGWRLELQGFYLFCAAAIMFLGSGRYAVRPD